jgi:hypothetical protein
MNDTFHVLDGDYEIKLVEILIIIIVLACFCQNNYDCHI